MKRITLWIFSGVVLIALFIVLCTFVRRPYETVLLERFGGLIDEPAQVRIMYHWYFKLPTDSVVRIDNRLHLWSGPFTQVTTAGSEPIVVRAYAAWHIVDARQFYKRTNGSDKQAELIMGQKLVGLVQAKLASHKIDEIFNADEKNVHTALIETEIAAEASKGTPDGKITGLADQGIAIVQVGFSRMAFPPDNAEKVFVRMASERALLATSYVADGQRQKLTIDGEAAAAVSKTKAEALRVSEETKGRADRQALETLSSVQDSPQKLEFYRYWKSIDFAKSALTNKNTYLVLPTDSPLLNALFSMPVSGIPGAPATRPAGGAAGAAPTSDDLQKAIDSAARGR